MGQLKLKVGFLFFLALGVTFFVVPSAQATGLQRFRRAHQACMAWLQDFRRKPEGVITSQLDDSQRIDLAKFTDEDFASIIGKPVSFLPNDRYSWKVVGPVIFYRPRAFSSLRRQIINEVMDASFRSDWLAEARTRLLMDHPASSTSKLAKGAPATVDIDQLLKDGIETAKIVLTLKSGRSIALPITTSYHPYHVLSVDVLKTLEAEAGLDEEEIARIEIYHSHPGSKPMDAGLSLQDLKMAKEIVAIFATRGLYPQVHVFAVSGSSTKRLINQFSVVAE